MQEETIKYKDSFLGEIELTKIAEINHILCGEHVCREVYEDSRGNFYIQVSGSPNNYEPIPMYFLHKEIVEKIIEYKNKKNG